MEILPLISFFTGVISILSPCILPIIPIFAAFSLNAKSKAELLSFILGLLSIFLAVIVLTGVFTSIVYRYMFYVRIISAVVLLGIGMMMWFGYSLSFSASAKNTAGIAGAFAFGLITSVSWAPCYSGYLISLIALLAGTGDAYAVLNLLLYVAGFGLALLALSLAISKIDLNKLILKTKYIPKIFAVLVIVGACYLFWESFKVLI